MDQRSVDFSSQTQDMLAKLVNRLTSGLIVLIVSVESLCIAVYMFSAFRARCRSKKGAVDLLVGPEPQPSAAKPIALEQAGGNGIKSFAEIKSPLHARAVWNKKIHA